MNFDDWYSANVAPTLPNDIPKKLRDAAREQMARCWNAALDAARDTGMVSGELDASEVKALKVKL